MPPSTSSGSSEITPDVVSHLAHLARIALTDDEIAKLTGELGQIVDSVAKVTAVATPDVPVEPVDRALVLAAAPEHIDGKFAVPQILGEDA